MVDSTVVDSYRRYVVQQLCSINSSPHSHLKIVVDEIISDHCEKYGGLTAPFVSIFSDHVGDCVRCDIFAVKSTKQELRAVRFAYGKDSFVYVASEIEPEFRNLPHP